MNWQTVEKLKRGEIVGLRPHGNSMKPKINSGDLITISPDIDDIETGDIVFCRVKGNFYVHLVKAISQNRYQIGNNRGRINGWIGKNSIFGKVIKVSW